MSVKIGFLFDNIKTYQKTEGIPRNPVTVPVIGISVRVGNLPMAWWGLTKGSRHLKTLTLNLTPGRESFCKNPWNTHNFGFPRFRVSFPRWSTPFTYSHPIRLTLSPFSINWHHYSHLSIHIYSPLILVPRCFRMCTCRWPGKADDRSRCISFILLVGRQGAGAEGDSGRTSTVGSMAVLGVRSSRLCQHDPTC